MFLVFHKRKVKQRANKILPNRFSMKNSFQLRNKMISFIKMFKNNIEFTKTGVQNFLSATQISLMRMKLLSGSFLRLMYYDSTNGSLFSGSLKHNDPSEQLLFISLMFFNSIKMNNINYKQLTFL